MQLPRDVIVVPPALDGGRLRDVLAALSSSTRTRSAAANAVRRGWVRHNDRPPKNSGVRVAAGDVLVVEAPEHIVTRVWQRPLTLIHVDPEVAVVHKPAGVPTSGNRWKTAQNAMPATLPPSERADALPVARPVHRLDARTAGLLVVARTARAQVHLSQAFARREVHKQYRAVLTGRLEDSGVIDAPVEGREARTRWAAVTHTPSLTCGWITTVNAWPETGRKHQLRRHFAAMGHPILGDERYGSEKVLRGQGLFLWALAIDLPHPDGGRLQLEIDEPAKLQAHLRRERRRVERRQSLPKQ